MFNLKTFKTQFFRSAVHLKRAPSCPLCFPALFGQREQWSPRSPLVPAPMMSLLPHSKVNEVKLRPDGLSSPKSKI